jgi:hypothetical protein
MERRVRQGMLALGFLGFGLVAAPGLANGQALPSGFGSGSSPTAGGTVSPGASMMGMYANPYMNPYANPFLNPMATQQQMTASNAAMYFLAAQQMNGGMGSGKLGGPKAAGAKGKAAAGNPVEPTRNAGANSPGAGASHYFNRSIPTSAASTRFYNRQTTHFPNNGR